MNVSWVATLSDGTTKAENIDFPIIEGERKPWVRFVKHVNDLGLFVTSLRLNVNGITIHMPRLKPKFEGFQPHYYSIEYRFEINSVLDNEEPKHYIQAAAHYENFWIRCIVDLETGNNSWLEVVDNSIAEPAMCPTPRRPLDNG